MEKERIAWLEAEVKRHQDLYYNGAPEISDAEFDSLWDELRSADPGNDLFKEVGSDRSGDFEKAAHLIPMGSQDKAANPEQFRKWHEKRAEERYLVQWKLDGASIELQYRGGAFLRAVTRGDGKVGDDITQNAIKMKGLAKKLPGKFSGGVRGEVVMSHAVFEESFRDKANCRNAANGIMKRKDGEGSDKLEIVCYDAMNSGDPGFFPDEEAKLAWLDTAGFTVVPAKVLSGPDAVIAYRAEVAASRSALPFDIDGLVVKCLGIDAEDMRRARPERQIAFKFELEEAYATLLAVEWSESGATYTPIGIISPVQLAGTTVQRANLCNPKLLAELGAMIGCRVAVTKRGEIIPKIERVVESPPGCRPIEAPTECGSCGAALVDEGTRLYCPNQACPKRDLHRLEKWVWTLSIMDLGYKILRLLFDSGRVRRVRDLYTLTKDELASYDRMGEKSAENILSAIEERRDVDLATFVAGFDIEGIGLALMQKVVASGYDTLGKLLEAEAGDIAGILGMGPALAGFLVEGLAELGAEMSAIVAEGLVRIKAPGSGPFSGKSFCFTGELASMKRGEAERIVAELGGAIKSSVTKDLSYLVTNDPQSGSSKNKKARELGIGVIGEGEFLEMAGRSGK